MTNHALPQWEVEALRRELGIVPEPPRRVVQTRDGATYLERDRIAEETVAEVRRLQGTGMGWKRIGEQVGLTKWQVRRALNPGYWRSGR